MITVTGLTKKYKQTLALQDINFTIKKGEIVGVVGLNGAGKSTLISIIATILKPTQGDVQLEGESIIQNPEVARGRIGYVPQEIALFSQFTVKENLHFWNVIGNKKGTLKSDSVQYITQIAGLENYMMKKVEELSGGLKRRLNIAVALLSYPEVLIMDEPTVGMDIQSRREMIEFIQKLSQDGTTIIYISHHTDEIEAICDHVLCLYQGRLVFDGTQKDLDVLSKKGIALDDLILMNEEEIKWKTINYK